MMTLPSIGIFIVILMIHQCTDALFIKPFRPAGHMMKHHFMGPPIHGPHGLHGLHGPHGPHGLHHHPPMFAPRYFHGPVMIGPNPMLSSPFVTKKIFANRPPHGFSHMLPNILPSLHPTFPRHLPQDLPRSNRFLHTTRRRLVPNNIDPYGYYSMRVQDNAGGFERNTRNYNNIYVNNYNRFNSNSRNLPQSRVNSLPYVSNERNTVRMNNNIIIDSNRRGNLNAPHLREVVESGNRIEMTNSIQSRNIGGSVRRQPLGRNNNNQNIDKGLSGRTLDFTASPSNHGRGSMPSNHLDKSNSGIISKKVSTRRNTVRSNKENVQVTSVITKILDKPATGSSHNIDLTNMKVPTDPRKGNRQSLSGSSIDLSSASAGAHIVGQKKLANPSATLSGPFSSVKPTVSVVTKAAANIENAAASAVSNANLAIATAKANLNGNAKTSAKGITKNDVVIVDTPVLKSDLNTPPADGSLSSVVDLTAVTGNDVSALNGGGNFGNGAVDVLTLDKTAYSQLEHALQSGQTVNAQLLDSILGASGHVGTSSSGSLSGGFASQGGFADVGTNNGSPQIYILDNAQAQQLTGSSGFAGSAAGANVFDSLTESTSRTSHTSQKSSSTSSSGHSVIDIPHAAKVLPARHGHGTVSGHVRSGIHSMGGGHMMPGGNEGHGLVGILGDPVGAITLDANTNIMGLFSSMPEGTHQNSVPTIPKAIDTRMSTASKHSGHGSHI